MLEGCVCLCETGNVWFTLVALGPCLQTKSFRKLDALISEAGLGLNLQKNLPTSVILEVDEEDNNLS